MTQPFHDEAISKITGHVMAAIEAKREPEPARPS